MRCRACGAELILTNVVPDDTVTVRGAEHHTFVCSGCHVTESPLQMALAMRSTSAKAAGLYVNAASPWRRALWLAQDLPAAVRGPRLFRPLLRLASALAREIIAVAHQVGRAALQLTWVGPRRRPTWSR